MLLDGFLNLAASQTARADPDTLGRSINHCADALQVGIKRTFRLVVGVTDVMTGLVFF